jgi:hypothetical protein
MKRAQRIVHKTTIVLDRFILLKKVARFGNDPFCRQDLDSHVSSKLCARQRVKFVSHPARYHHVLHELRARLRHRGFHLAPEDISDMIRTRHDRRTGCKLMILAGGAVDVKTVDL